MKIYQSLRFTGFIILILIPILLLIMLDIVLGSVENFYLRDILPTTSSNSIKQTTTIIYTLIIFYVTLAIFIFIVPFIRRLKSKDNEEVSLLPPNNIDTWKKMHSIFESNNKTEAILLIKKNKIENEHESDNELKYLKNDFSLSSIFKLKNYINVFDTLHDTIQDIDDKLKKTNDQERLQNDLNELKASNDLISKLIYETKLQYHKVNKKFASWILINTFYFFITLWVFTFLLDTQVNISSFININDFNNFILGMFLALISLPTGMWYHHTLKYLKVANYPDSTHIQSIVLLKNLFYFASSFIITLAVLSLGLYVLSHSGIEYSKALHFLVTLILPSMELSDIPQLIINNLDTEVVFVIVTTKLFVLISLFILLSMAIRHLMEHYLLIYDHTKMSGLSIPPEFAKFFSYLVLTVFSLILLYGTLFINYPNLEREYKTCIGYTQLNYNTYSNCNKFINDINATLNEKKEYESTQNTLPQTLKYCNEILNDKPNIPLSSCNVGMSLEISKERSMANALIGSPSRSLSDYLPLSIFLTLFGVVMMIATKNLLENYFTGLSLKINSPYEEGERIRIDDGEMLTVKHVGFRAVEFYGISSHAKLVIPHQQLTNSVITNYTKPTLDYREKIIIHIPDQKYNPNIPRIAEKIMLLAAFIATGVKKPRLGIKQEIQWSSSTKNRLQPNQAKEFFDNLDNNLAHNIMLYKSQIITYNKDLATKETREDIANRVGTIETQLEPYSTKIIQNLLQLDKQINQNRHNKKRPTISDKLFLNKILSLVKENPKQNIYKSEVEDKNIIRKIVASIVSVIYDYESQTNKELVYEYDEYLIKRKKDVIANKNKQELEEIADLLVNINYYYFALAKQLWKLKEDSQSARQKNKIDEASLDLLDVPRVTSKHRRDIEQDAFWEVSLMVTVELAEQSDEIVQHINMFIDELWDIFKIPSICNDGKSKKDKNTIRKYRV